MAIPRLTPHGIERGPAKRRKAPRTHRPESERRKAEPWRKAGYGSEYRRRRLAEIESAGGRCRRCGRPVAVMTADGWRMRGGEVHHVTPLSRGGCDGRLMLLCVSCHRIIDAEMRRGRGDRGRNGF